MTFPQFIILCRLNITYELLKQKSVSKYSILQVSI